MNKLDFINLPSVPSTNTWLAEHADMFPADTVLTTGCQTAGRGQRGNKWESKPGKNLTFSMLVHPAGVDAAGQFIISQAVALAIVDSIVPLLPGHEVTVKWPNDIYVGDCKICGILIENTLRGRSIMHSIIGVGLNVNQQRFESDAPNPVSLTQLTGITYHLDSMLRAVATRIADYLHRATISDEARMAVRQTYASKLWRREGVHPFHDTLTGETILAAIADVAPDGHLTLTPADNTPPRTYAFKEVSYIL